METRTIEQVKIYSLHLNSIYANYESSNIVAFSYSESDLIDWYNSLKVNTYKENTYYKNFKKSTPLENYNLIEYADHTGIQSRWATANRKLSHRRQHKHCRRRVRGISSFRTPCRRARNQVVACRVAPNGLPSRHRQSRIWERRSLAALDAYDRPEASAQGACLPEYRNRLLPYEKRRHIRAQ